MTEDVHCLFFSRAICTYLGLLALKQILQDLFEPYWSFSRSMEVSFKAIHNDDE